jgi:hypothetical protein
LRRRAGRAAEQRCRRAKQGQQLPSARHTPAGSTPTGAAEAEDWRQQQQAQAKHAWCCSRRRCSSSRARTVPRLVLQLQVCAVNLSQHAWSLQLSSYPCGLHTMRCNQQQPQPAGSHLAVQRSTCAARGLVLSPMFTSLLLLLLFRGCGCMTAYERRIATADVPFCRRYATHVA